MNRLFEIMGKVNPDFNVSSKKLILYHGTRYNFDRFDLRFFNAGSGDGGWLGYGVYLTNDFNYAESYGDVLECEVTLKSPHIISEYGYSTTPERLRNELQVNSSREITNKLRDMGHDSVMLQYDDAEIEGGVFIEVCIFDPSNIKILDRYSHGDDSKVLQYKRGYKV